MMLEALASISIALISANVGVILWAVRTLWSFDRRLVRVETKLNLQEEM